MRLAILLASLMAQPVFAQEGKDAVIDYAAGGGIRDWHAENDRGIYVRDSRNDWYYIQFKAPCPGVLTGQQIAFDTDVVGRFDKLSRVVTQTETCGVESIQRTKAPQAKGG